MYTLGAGRIFIKSIIIVCLLNLMAWKASWAHRTGENEEKKKIMIKYKIGPNVERLWKKRNYFHEACKIKTSFHTHKEE